MSINNSANNIQPQALVLFGFGPQPVEYFTDFFPMVRFNPYPIIFHTIYRLVVLTSPINIYYAGAIFVKILKGIIQKIGKDLNLRQLVEQTRYQTKKTRIISIDNSCPVPKYIEAMANYFQGFCAFFDSEICFINFGLDFV